MASIKHHARMDLQSQNGIVIVIVPTVLVHGLMRKGLQNIGTISEIHHVVAVCNWVSLYFSANRILMVGSSAALLFFYFVFLGV
jgi:hypothetical protein